MRSSFEAFTDETRELALLDRAAPPSPRPRYAVSVGAVAAVVVLLVVLIAA